MSGEAPLRLMFSLFSMAARITPRWGARLPDIFRQTGPLLLSCGRHSGNSRVYYLENKCKPEDIIIIHDGIRPLVDATVLSDVIVKCKKYGNAVTSLPYNEQIFLVEDEISTVEYIPRETLRRVSTPQAYMFGKLNAAYHEAFEKGIGIYGSSYTNTMMVDLGERLYFAAGSDKNIKLTTKDDLEMFKAYLKSDKENWLK